MHHNTDEMTKHINTHSHYLIHTVAHRWDNKMQHNSANSSSQKILNCLHKINFRAAVSCSLSHSLTLFLHLSRVTQLVPAEASVIGWHCVALLFSPMFHFAWQDICGLPTELRGIPPRLRFTMICWMQRWRWWWWWWRQGGGRAAVRGGAICFVYSFI